jgi:hypothetical protein
MGIQIAGLMIMSLVIMVVSFMLEAATSSDLMTTSAATQTIDSTGDRTRTNLEFVSTSEIVGELTVNLKNTGFTSVYDFSKMDFFVEYVDSVDNLVITRLTYTTGALANNEWKVTSITPDGFQPNAWNPSETIILDAKLSPAQKAWTTSTTTVVTPNGVAAVTPFGPDGFFWFPDAPDISLTATESWEDIDLSGSVPTGTSGAVVEIINTGTTGTLSGVVRGKEDTLDYMDVANYEEVEDETHRWQIVKVDSNRMIQGYIEDVQIDFKLRGYTLGLDPLYFSNPPDITPSTQDEWTTIDVSAYVDDDADGVILFIDSVIPVKREYAIRESGSSFDITNRELEGYGNTMYLVGINARDQFDAFIENVLNMQVYLLAQTKGSVVYNLEDVYITQPATGSWQELDADNYNIPVEANGLFIRIENADGSDQIAAIRHGDSTDTWTPDVGNDTRLIAGAGINANNAWDEYITDTNLDLYIAAYTVPLTE